MKFFKLFATSRALLLTLCFLAPLQAALQAQQIQSQQLQSQQSDGVITNATAADLAPLQRLNTLLEQAVTARDANTLQLFGVGDEWRQYPALIAHTNITHAALQAGGALVRQQYEILGSNAGTPITLASGAHDLWLTKLNDGSYAFTPKRWAPPTAAVTALSNAAQEEWKINSQTTLNSNAPTGILHLVAERSGERWIALRRSRWNGILYDGDQLAQSAVRVARANPAADPQDVGLWMAAQMKQLEGRGAGTAHFLFQAGRRGWIGVGAAFDVQQNASPENAQEVAKLRKNMESAAYLLAASHRDFGNALAKIGLTGEAADELEKAEALQPGIVGTARLAQAAQARTSDPQPQAALQMQQEARVGLDSEHPVYIINALMKERPQPQTPLQALRLGLEYAKLADDDNSLKYLRVAEQMVNGGGLANSTPGEVGWADVLHEHLKEREEMRAVKPRNVVRSALFTVRCTLNDPKTIEVLAALETAQHTVYSGFGIPMGNTEVLVWQTQTQFQRYTTRFAPQGANEFVAALTLTKLISTQTGPMVLGEEVNIFNDERANMFSTVPHEYGHVAVRQLSRGRMVPVWMNEGIATAVEGGYDGYIERVRKYAAARRLLSWPEIKEWNVDGERAFLAYSQANSMIDFIVSIGGREAVLEILRQIGQDVPPEAAIQQVLKTSSANLWAQWAREGIR